MTQRLKRALEISGGKEGLSRKKKLQFGRSKQRLRRWALEIQSKEAPPIFNFSRQSGETALVIWRVKRTKVLDSATAQAACPLCLRAEIFG